MLHCRAPLEHSFRACFNFDFYLKNKTNKQTNKNLEFEFVHEEFFVAGSNTEHHAVDTVTEERGREGWLV